LLFEVPMRVSVIAAVDRKGLIGDDRGLPWHLPADLRRFRDLTLGKPIILGRTTHEHIGRPLPGRQNIVLSRRPDGATAGCTVVNSLDEALRVAADTSEEAFVIGGGQVYREAIPRADRIYLTVVDGVFAGNTYFPLEELASGQWLVRQHEVRDIDAKNAYRHLFLVLDRRPPNESADGLFDIHATLAQQFVVNS
jgi:dihydrofolate reductase